MKTYCRLLLVANIAAAFCFPRISQAGVARLITGADSGAGPHVKVFSAESQAVLASFFAFAPTFSGGVRVAAGDLDDDGRADILVGGGHGGLTHVKAFDGTGFAEMRSFFSYSPSFTGGVFVASADVNGDGYADMITGIDSGAPPHVKVFNGVTGAVMASFFAFGESFTGGVRVAAGDVNADGRADLVVGSGPGSAHVKVFNGQTFGEMQSFFAYPGFTGGVYVASGDVDGDGHADIVTGAGSTSPHVKVFSGVNGALLRSFLAYTTSSTGGVRVAATDLNGDGKAEIITAPGPGMLSQIRVFDGATLEIRADFVAYGAFTNGAYVAAESLVRPTLQIQFEKDENIRISWPAGSGCSLQVSTSLGDSRRWMPVPTQAIQSGNRLYVRVPPGENATFFRLSCSVE